MAIRLLQGHNGRDSRGPVELVLNLWGSAGVGVRSRNPLSEPDYDGRTAPVEGAASFCDSWMCVGKRFCGKGESGGAALVQDALG